MSSIRPLGRMLVSKEKNRSIDIDIRKISLGSFYTTKSGWLTSHVRDFLAKALIASKGRLLDPFAGDGHLLEAIAQDETLGRLITDSAGLDISGSWPINDSLLEIPNPNGAVLVTNPPYLANHSARRKGVQSLVSKYFDHSTRNNLYQIALDNALKNADFVVAIIPETFLLSNYPKNRLELAVVIKDELFGDTEAPALVACFSNQAKNDAKLYIQQSLIGNFTDIFELRNPKIKQQHEVLFNLPTGRIGLRAVDGSDGQSLISFVAGKDFSYPRASVRASSRLMTYLDVPELSDSQIGRVIERANMNLTIIRKVSGDLVLAPFKGNDKYGNRRRRLDYALARKLLNHSVNQILER
jgi:hypothetical protein